MSSYGTQTYELGISFVLGLGFVLFSTQITCELKKIFLGIDLGALSFVILDKLILVFINAVHIMLNCITFKTMKTKLFNKK